MEGNVNGVNGSIAQTHEANFVAACTFWTLTADICPDHRHILASLYLHLNAIIASFKTNYKGNLFTQSQKRYLPLNSDQRCKIVLFFRLSHPTLQPFTPTLWEGGSRDVIGRRNIGVVADWSASDFFSGFQQITSRCVDHSELFTVFSSFCFHLNFRLEK